MNRKLSLTCAAILSLMAASMASPHGHRQAKITMKQAEELALKTEPGTIKSKELEREKGKLIYSFDIETKSDGIHEINIDAKTGKLVEDTKEDVAAEAKERRQDRKAGKKSK